MTMTAQEGRPPLSGVFHQQNSAGFQTTLQASAQLGIDHETCRRITQQLVDMGEVRDRRVNGKGMHLLSTREVGLIQNMYIKTNLPKSNEEVSKAKESEKTTMPITNPVGDEKEKEKETSLEWACRERFGVGVGKRLSIEEMSQATGLTTASIQSYIYRSLLPRRKDPPTPKNLHPAFYFFESDAFIFNKNRPQQPPQLARAQKKDDVQLPPQKQEAPMAPQPTKPITSSIPEKAAQLVQTGTALVSTNTHDHDIREVEQIDVELVDPRGLENATKDARLFSYLYTRCGAIYIEGWERETVKVKLEPNLHFDAETIGITITPAITYWEVFMTTTAHPETSEAYQVVLTDRFYHAKVETNSSTPPA